MRPKVIGVLGGIASGKTTVAEMLGSLGARVIDADKMVHQFLDTPEIKARLRERWGEAVFDDQGRVDRPRLSRIVFSNGEALKALTDILHPPVLQAIRKELSEEDAGVVILDAALLEETGLVELCDLLIFVEAEEEIKEKRARQWRNWPPGEVSRRAHFQAAEELKRRKAHYVINNNFSREKTFNQVKEFWNKFVT